LSHEVAVRANGLERRFGERVALRDVSFSLPAGETLAVFGANGAGKSTLLRVLATLLRPHAGEVEVLGSGLAREGWKVRGRVGFLGHEPLLYRELTVRENLRYHARLHSVDARTVDGALERVGLAHRAEDPVITLSRGMTQRAAIARATLHSPDLLLLDEPFANLDPAGAEAIAPLLRGPARVLISHDLEAGLAEADRVLALRDGAVSLSCAAAETSAAAVREAIAP
jgi:heme exporter protein A